MRSSIVRASLGAAAILASTSHAVPPCCVETTTDATYEGEFCVGPSSTHCETGDAGGASGFMSTGTPRAAFCYKNILNPGASFLRHKCDDRPGGYIQIPGQGPDGTCCYFQAGDVTTTVSPAGYNIIPCNEDECGS